VLFFACLYCGGDIPDCVRVCACVRVLLLLLIQQEAAPEEKLRYIHWKVAQSFPDHEVCTNCRAVEFPSNYIRTTKYTPLTFIPHVRLCSKPVVAVVVCIYRW